MIQRCVFHIASARVFIETLLVKNPLFVESLSRFSFSFFLD